VKPTDFPSAPKGGIKVKLTRVPGKVKTTKLPLPFRKEKIIGDSVSRSSKAKGKIRRLERHAPLRGGEFSRQCVCEIGKDVHYKQKKIDELKQNRKNLPDAEENSAARSTTIASAVGKRRPDGGSSRERESCDRGY